MANLQKLRIDSGLSQSQLANKAGLSVRTLQVYEQGQREVSHARIDVILKLCIALGCEMDDLLCPEFKVLYHEYLNR